MLSWESATMPPTCPIRQSFGNGFGQLASTTKLGDEVPAGAREGQRVAPSWPTAPVSRSAAAAALSAVGGVSCGGRPQAAIDARTTAPTKRTGDMASPEPHRRRQCGPFRAYWLLRGCWLL